MKDSIKKKALDLFIIVSMDFQNQEYETIEKPLDDILLYLRESAFIRIIEGNYSDDDRLRLENAINGIINI